MQWIEPVVFALFPPFVAGALFGPVIGMLDIFDLWRGRWVPKPLAKRIPRSFLPRTADVARWGRRLRAPVRTAPARLQEQLTQGVRRAVGVNAWIVLCVIVPVALLAALAFGGLVLTVHPGASEDPAFARANTLPFFSLSAGLASAAVLWGYRSQRLYRRRLGKSFPLTSVFDLARLLRSCWGAAEGRLPLLTLDERVTAYTSQLGWFAAYGVERERRRATLRPHLARVQQALETEMANVLRDGPGAAPRLARLVAVMLDRSAQGRWMGLLDEADLPQEAGELVTASEDKHDRWIVLGGSTAAAAMVAAAVAAGLPAAAVAPAALTALIGPAVMWGSGKLGTPREQMSTVAAGLGPPAADTAAPASTPPTPGV